MDWHALMKMKVDDLRDLAKEKTDLDAVSGLAKEDLVAKLAEALGIPRPHKVVDAGEKAPIKARIRQLKAERAAALEAGDGEAYRRVLRSIHAEKHRLRRMGHLTH